ncbi:MAG: hypothetical protein FJ098_04420 [Deltaproteobacteria bacterium]|nr:hypothetical protein [Deltaproteobacteria bacterium]
MMEIKVSHQKLLAAVEAVSRVIGKGGVYGSAASHVMLQVDPTWHRILVKGTDLNTYLQVSVPILAILDDEVRRVLLPKKALLDQLKQSMKGAKGKKGKESKICTLFIPPDSTPTSGEGDTPRVTVHCEGATLTVLPGDDKNYPAWPDECKDQTVWSSLGILDEKARETLAWLILSAGWDATRRYTHGVHMERDWWVTTDGSRMHIAPSPVKLDILSEQDPGGTCLLLDRCVVDILLKLPWVGNGPVTLFGVLHPEKERGATGILGFSQVRIYGPNWVLWSRCFDGRFPPWRQVVPAPEKADVIWSFRSQDMTQVLESKGKNGGKHVELQDTEGKEGEGLALKLTSRDADGSSWEGKVLLSSRTGPLVPNGPEVKPVGINQGEIAKAGWRDTPWYNPLYILDALEGSESEGKIEMLLPEPELSARDMDRGLYKQEYRAPMQITGLTHGRKAVVMPMGKK